MRKWLPAIVVIGLAVVAYLFVFNRSTRLDSTRHPVYATNSVAETTNDSIPGTPSTASASSNPSPQRADTVVGAPASQPPAPKQPASQSVALPEPSVPEEELPRLPAATVLENVNAAFRYFRSRFTSNPIGTNEEITRALNGENPGQVRFLRMEDGMRINDRGELIDTWGTPYFFHQLSGTEMEIHCAGPDKVMWTSDDLVIQ